MRTPETKKQTTAEIVSEVQPTDDARVRLKELSQSVHDLVEKGVYPTINEAIIAVHYRDGRHTEFKNYEQWKQDGFQVQKGEKAFLLWGRPRESKPNDKEKDELEMEQSKEDAYTFFPVAHVFSNAQVVEMNRQVLDELKGVREQDDVDIER